MSQIILPWTPKDPPILAQHRIRAIRVLLAVGAGLLALGILVFIMLNTWQTQRLPDWGVAATWFGFVGPFATGALLFAGGVVVTFYRQVGRLLQRPYVAFAILSAAVLVTGLAVWGVSRVLGFMADLRDDIGSESALTAETIYEAIHRSCPVPLAAYLLWPFQFQLVRDLLAMAGVVGLVCTVAAFGIWWERKVAARMQSRLGPMRVGRWHGWAQSPADGIKLIMKEDIIPTGGDGLLFRLAPYLAFVPAVCAFVALPFAAAWAFRDLDVALIFILAMLGIEVIGVIIAGWASNNKWSVYGSMREACQMISYEIPMGMSLLVPVMMAGSLRLSEIVGHQDGGFHNWLVFANPWCFVAFIVYFVAALASCKRTPFDLPEAESELVAGFLTEYSGYRWALFFFGEYTGMFAVSGLAVLLFLGGWASPLPASWAPTGNGFHHHVIRGLLFAGPAIFLVKAMLLFFVQLWLRWTLPRVRIDQILYACVQVMLPLAMVVLLANTLWVLGVKHYEVGWLRAIDAVLHWILVAVGLATAVAIIGIAGYGFMNRRRLVGRLAIDHLPGA